MDEPPCTRQNFQEISASLISRDFEECELKCRERLRALKSHPESQGYRDNLEQVMNGLMQSLAEQSKWEEVLPLLTEVYGAIENMPVIIIKNCLLLHSKVQEYTTCTTVYNIWLNAEQSHQEIVSEEARRMLVDIFIRRILIPQKKLDQINSCLERADLEHKTIQHLKQRYDQMIGETKRKRAQDGKANSTESSQENTNTNSGVEDRMQSKLDLIVERLMKAMYTLCTYIKTSPHTRKVVGCISGLLAFYFILTTVNIVDSHSTMVSLSNTLVNLLTYIKYKLKATN